MIKFIRYWLRNTLGFSKTETNGLPILILIVVVFFFGPLLLKWNSNSSYTAAANDKLILDSLIRQLTVPSELSDEGKAVATMFKFNPNSLGFDSLLLLDIKKSVAQRIVNYRNAGGIFKEKKDLKKIYGLTTENYNDLLPYIDLPKTKTHEQYTRHEVPEKEKVEPKEFVDRKKALLNFDINQADTSQLMKIYGIGPVLSGRILKYRNLLGGFVKKEQLKEVYGIQEDVFRNLAVQVYITENYIPKLININKNSVKQLASHPYVSYNVAKSIYNFRLQHGPFRSKQDLLKIHLFDSVLLENIVPYIDL